MNSFVDLSGAGLDSKAPDNKCLQNWEHCPHYIENYIFRRMKTLTYFEKKTQKPKKPKIFKWSENIFRAAKANRFLDFFCGVSFTRKFPVVFLLKPSSKSKEMLLLQKNRQTWFSSLLRLQHFQHWCSWSSWTESSITGHFTSSYNSKWKLSVGMGVSRSKAEGPKPGLQKHTVMISCSRNHSAAVK